MDRSRLGGSLPLRVEGVLGVVQLSSDGLSAPHRLSGAFSPSFPIRLATQPAVTPATSQTNHSLTRSGPRRSFVTHLRG